MPQIIYTAQSTKDLVRLADFIASIEPKLKKRTLEAISGGIMQLQTFPQIAKPCPDEKYKHMRELFIPFGKNGYLVLYEYHEKHDYVLINSIRHSLEENYKIENS